MKRVCEECEPLKRRQSHHRGVVDCKENRVWGFWERGSEMVNWNEEIGNLALKKKTVIIYII